MAEVISREPIAKKFLRGDKFVKHGKDTLHLTTDDLFDRIVNLKFIRYNHDSFVLRSDYEPVFYPDGNLTFKRCTQKPHIAIHYKQVAQTVAIEVDIEVTNLFIDKSHGDPLIAASSPLEEGYGNPITNIVVQMGYINQFPDWTKRSGKDDIRLYYDLNNNYVSSEEEARSGMQMSVMVLDTYTKGDPPDQVTYFHGIIGTVETGLLWRHPEGDLTKNYGNPDLPQGHHPLEDLFFQWITKRFIRPNVIHRVNTVYDGNDKSVIKRQKVEIYGYHDYRYMAGRVINRSEQQRGPLYTPDTAWTDLADINGALVDGVFSKEEALKFGVICSLSYKLRNTAMAELSRYGLSAEQLRSFEATDPAAYDYPMNKIGSQIEDICKTFHFLRYYVLPDGSYYFYHASESEADLFSGVRIDAYQDGSDSRQRVVLLPAVYDIAYGGTRTIRCLFYYLIAPMTVVLFMSRYYIGSLVGFYYHPKEGDDAYLVLQVKVDFDTTGEDNMMELMCVDMHKDYQPTWDKNTGRIEWNPGEVIAPMERERHAKWAKTSLTVVWQARDGRHQIIKETDSRWFNIIELWLFAPLEKSGQWPWPFKPRSKEAYIQALNDLKRWNGSDMSTEKEGHYISPNVNQRNLFAKQRYEWPTANGVTVVSDENTEWEELTEGEVKAVPILYSSTYIPPFFETLYGGSAYDENKSDKPDVVWIKYPWMPEERYLPEEEAPLTEVGV
jgi:hypothetical protein